MQFFKFGIRKKNLIYCPVLKSNAFLRDPSDDNLSVNSLAPFKKKTAIFYLFFPRILKRRKWFKFDLIYIYFIKYNLLIINKQLNK